MNTKKTAYAAVFCLALAPLGCSSGGAPPNSGKPSSNGNDDGGGGNEDGGSGSDDLAMRTDGMSGGDLRGQEDLAPAVDLAPFKGTLNVKIFASNTCKISTDPAAIALPAGSSFTVNWMNSATSSYEVDVAKRDPFNLVPILIGLEIGNSYHDTVREWCGMFTGRFWFRISTACDQFEIPVDCK